MNIYKYHATIGILTINCWMLASHYLQTFTWNWTRKCNTYPLNLPVTVTLKSHEAVCPMESVATYMTIHCPILKRLPVLYPFCSTTMGEPLSSTAIGTGHVTTAKSSFSVVFTNMLDGQELNVGGRSTIQGGRRRKMMLLLSGWTNLLTKSKKLQNRMGTLLWQLSVP